MRPFLKGFLITAIPLAALFGVASGGWIARWSWDGLATLAAAATILTATAFVAGIVLAVMRRTELAAGVFAGMGVGVLGGVVTCFASITNI